MSADGLGISTGQNWKDALAGAALIGKKKSVMLLADSKSNALAVSCCRANKASIRTSAYVFGGPAAVSANIGNVLVKSTQ